MLTTGLKSFLLAAGLALVAGITSIARLRPAIRNPTLGETRDDVPVMRQTR